MVSDFEASALYAELYRLENNENRSTTRKVFLNLREFIGTNACFDDQAGDSFIVCQIEIDAIVRTKLEPSLTLELIS